MNRFFWLLLILISATSCGQQSVSSSNSKSKKGSQVKTEVPDEFRVVFYNVENLFDTHDDPKKKDDDFTPDGRKEWTGSRYQKKLNRITEVIEAMKIDGHLPAIIGLAEIENEGVLEDLRDKLLKSGQDYGIVHKDSRDGIDVGLLYDKAYVSDIDSDFHTIRFSNRDVKSRDILQMKARIGGREDLHVFVNHWPSRREGVQKSEPKRIDAARVLKSEVDDILDDDPQAHIVIMGDFNDFPENKSIVNELNAATKPSSKNDLNNLAYAFEKRGLGTAVYKGDWNMYDQIICSGALLDDKGFDVTKKGMEIFDEDFIMYFDKRSGNKKPNRTYGNKYYGGYSDHLPVMLNLTLND
jgi:predicted extracellular nuclease